MNSVTEASKQQLLDKVLSIEKHCENLKNNIHDYGKSFQSIEIQTEKISNSLENLNDYKEHQFMENSLRAIGVALKECYTQEEICEQRSRKVIPEDLNKFLKNWRLIRDFIKEYCQATPAAIILKKLRIFSRADPPKTQADIEKDIHEKNAIEKKLDDALVDMHKILEDFIHCQIMYHAKCLESWNKSWSVLQHEIKLRNESKEQEENKGKEKKEANHPKKRHHGSHSKKMLKKPQLSSSSEEDEEDSEIEEWLEEINREEEEEKKVKIKPKLKSSLRKSKEKRKDVKSRKSKLMISEDH